MGKGKKGSKALKIFLLMILILIVVVTVIFALNYKNISALYKGFTANSEDIKNQIYENKKETEKALSDSGIDVSDDVLEKLESGELTEDEMAFILLDSMNKSESGSLDEKDSANVTENNSGNTATDNKAQTNKEPVKKPGTSKPDSTQHSGGQQSTSNTDAILSEEEYNKKTSELVAKVYVIKSNFTSSLAAFESKIVSQYKSLPAEQRTNAMKAKIVSENMSYVLGLEAQCDAQVKAVTDELTKLMKENGKSTSLADAINEAYANEKALKKAYYISLYK